MEPELGIGIVLETAGRRVRIFFAAAEVIREYTPDAAPLKRVIGQEVETVTARDGRRLVVEDVAEQDGLMTYIDQDGCIMETEISDNLSISKPDKRLLSGRIDSPGLFDLRCRMLKFRHRWAGSDLRGFAGGRIDLIPHQLYIAHEVSRRQFPRVLLADEVGLGKTIEAAMILNRLLSSGRISRVLILVPEALVNQWLVELLRKFNLKFRIADSAYCEQTVENPFREDQLYIAGQNFVTASRKRMQQVLEADWDLLIVDEAHHLEEGSTPYDFVAAMSEMIPRVLLLTATPEQAGLDSHFARLKLLDADRHYDFEAFKAESAHYAETAALARRIEADQKLSAADKKILKGAGIDPASADLLNDLLDRHGPGRVIFRNTRDAISGFPQRRAVLHELNAPGKTALRQEFECDLRAGAMEYDFRADPRIACLAELLRASDAKILLICSSPAKVTAIETALMQHLSVKAALFHENMTIIQRDRNAAWFAEPDGARVLICSEIGSEGRNFQFASNLFLFDLPLDPELLEQRIGRLDRIGQQHSVQIHLPLVADSPQAILTRWYHEGLEAFQKNLACGQQIREKYAAAIAQMALDGSDPDNLLTATRQYRDQLNLDLKQGRDRLLEMSSCRRDQAAEMVTSIAALDEDPALEDLMCAVFEYFNVEYDEILPRTYIVSPAGQFSLPGIREDGMTLTFDRATALAREDIDFITWDHPMVAGAWDLVLGSEQGNNSLMLWPRSATPGLLLEACYVLECVAPDRLDIERFLPSEPISILVDQSGEVVEADYAGQLHAPDQITAEKLIKPLGKLLPRLKRRAKKLAREEAEGLVNAGLERLQHELGHELERLESLSQINPAVKQAEIEELAAEIQLIKELLPEARVRLDNLRIIFCGPLPIGG